MKGKQRERETGRGRSERQTERWGEGGVKGKQRERDSERKE